ncbi:hypothetical protein AB0L40_26385, partial [Patulibacter sp. NPDC049589]
MSTRRILPIALVSTLAAVAIAPSADAATSRFFTTGAEQTFVVHESLKEAAYLLRSPENARRLLGSIQRLEAGE